MAVYDMIMLTVLVAATVWGAWKGMAWQIAAIAAFVVSYFAALRFSEPLAPYFSSEAPWNKFLAMLAIYLVTSLVIWLAFRLVAGWIDRVKLREFDRQLGALFGVAKGVLLCVVITFFVVTLSDDWRDRVLKSRSGYYISVLLDRAPAAMPVEIHEVLRPYMHQLEEELEPAATAHKAAS